MWQCTKKHQRRWSSTAYLFTFELTIFVFIACSCDKKDVWDDERRIERDERKGEEEEIGNGMSSTLTSSTSRLCFRRMKGDRRKDKPALAVIYSLVHLEVMSMMMFHCRVLLSFLCDPQRLPFSFADVFLISSTHFCFLVSKRRCNFRLVSNQIPTSIDKKFYTFLWECQRKYCVLHITRAKREQSHPVVSSAVVFSQLPWLLSPMWTERTCEETGDGEDKRHYFSIKIIYLFMRLKHTIFTCLFY